MAILGRKERSSEIYSKASRGEAKPRSLRDKDYTTVHGLIEMLDACDPQMNFQTGWLYSAPISRDKEGNISLGLWPTKY
jgi:hypothetical protein